MSTHILIPDTQIRPGVPIDHLRWAGQYIVDEFAGEDDISIIHIGDHWDMHSLSSYDEGKMEMEGRRYKEDIAAGNAGFTALNQPIIDFNKSRALAHRKQWSPRREFLLGNHEARIFKAISKTPKLEGVITIDDFNVLNYGWNLNDFLVPVKIDGVVYAHYFYNPMTGIPYGGMIESRLKTIGHSFSMGHQQHLLYGMRYVEGKAQHGLVAGAFYIHNEDYKGPQGNEHWRGIIVKHEVENGTYDPMFVSLNYLCKRYEGVSIAKFAMKKYGIVR